MRADVLNAGMAGPGGFVRDMDARIKLVFAVSCLAMSAASSGPEVPLFAGMLGAAMLVMSGVRPAPVVIRAAEPVFFGCVIALFQLFLVPGEMLFGVELFGVALSASAEGLTRGLYIIARVFGGVMVVLFVSMTTPVDRLLSAAAWLKAPRGLVEVSMFAYRYVFSLLDDALTVYSAQRGRLGYSGIRRSVRSLGMLAGAVFLRAYAQAEATGEAMAQRGYSGCYVPVCAERGSLADIALMGGLTLATLTLFVLT